MKPKILFVNPPIYDFAAYDFWLKPQGILNVAGKLRSIAELSLFDYLDRLAPQFDPKGKIKTTPYGAGPYPREIIPTPAPLKDIPRRFGRYGIPRNVFREYLTQNGPYDVVLIQTVMTYWYPGYQEVIEDIRQLCPGAKIVLGGFYTTCCHDHAQSIGADAVIKGNNLEPLWNILGQQSPAGIHLPAWELYPKLETATMKLTRGCPFRCSYCYVPQSDEAFQTRSLDTCLAELEQLVNLGVKNIAFYDDALLFEPEEILLPFMQEVINGKISINFHTPNALHARYMTVEVANAMVAAGTKTFYLGFESQSEKFHTETSSGKVVSEELTAAVDCLKNAGADPHEICAYEMLGHPLANIQQLESSMRFANSLGIRIMLSDFSPIPGTPDGELFRKYADLKEPLNHSKTASPIRFMGSEQVNYYKHLCAKLNKKLIPQNLV